MTDTKQELRNHALGILKDLENAKRAKDLLLEHCNDFDSEVAEFSYEEEEDYNFLAGFLESVDMLDYNGYGREDGYQIVLNDSNGNVIEYLENEYHSPLEIVHCKNTNEASGDYYRITFCVGGPSVYAEKTPFQDHFFMCAHWGTDSFEWPDLNDAIEDRFGYLFE